MNKSKMPRLKVVRRLGSLIPGLIRVDGDLKRPYPPGQHGATRRSKIFDYSLRLREKQKLRFNYGLSEKKLIHYVKKAFKVKGDHGLILLSMLESRLDNVVFRSGFASSVRSARQIVGHGHILVNLKKVNIPSFNVENGDVIKVLNNSRMKNQIFNKIRDPENLKLPSYLNKSYDNDFFITKIKAPSRTDISIAINEQLVVEFYAGL